ncbi:MAG: hypothetical protein E7399_04855, partial [Ruminococcaceae bacterium]|nr:hypothetical protein [Oscillospiraceae bacterium]
VADETVADETVADETVADETVADETVADETVADETVADEITNNNSESENQESNAMPVIMALLVAITIFILGFFIINRFIFGFERYHNDGKKGFGIEPEQSTIEETVTPEATEKPTSAAPDFSEVDATGYRQSDTDRQGRTYHYFPHYATDGDWSTCWGIDPSYGENPSITLRDSIPQHVTGIRFSNGYFHTQEAYIKNKRITKARISYQGGYQDVTCPLDQYGVMQEVIFHQPVDTTYVTLQVLESVDGGWHDVSISEIEVF